MASFITSAGGNGPSGGSTAPGMSYWLGTKILNQPLAMHVEAAAQLQGAIQSGVFDNKLALSVGGAGLSKFTGSPVRNGGYRVTDDGIAIVPVSGVLLDRGAWLGDFGGWATSYEGLAEQFDKLARDGAIKSVILDIDSGGGMAAGLFDLTSALAKLKKKKRVYAIGANMAASAAYAIGCAAHEFHVTRGGMAGSIGVISVHMSYQQMLESSGVEPTIIHAGSHKADANPYQALSHGARSEMASGIDDIYDEFVAHVAKARDMDGEAVRATEARVYSGKRAVTSGLADSVKSFDELLTHIRKEKSQKPSKSKSRTKGVQSMSERENQPGAQAPENTPAASVPSVPAASVPVVPAAPVAAAPVVPGANAGDERSRIKAIITSTEAEGRKDLAEHLAFNTDMSLTDACATLAASSKAGSEAKVPANENDASLTNALANEMSKPGNSAGIKPGSGEVKAMSFTDFAAAAPQRNKLH